MKRLKEKRVRSQLQLLQDEWYEKLAQEGFEDIETSSGSLRDINRRSVHWDTRDLTSAFYSRLERIVAENRSPPTHLKILSLYCQGVWQVDISRQLGIKLRTIEWVIGKYRKIVT